MFAFDKNSALAFDGKGSGFGRSFDSFSSVTFSSNFKISPNSVFQRFSMNPRLVPQGISIA